MARKAVLTQAQVATTVLNNAITVRMDRKKYSDVWRWTFLRNSIDGALAINAPKHDPVYGIRVMEATTNLLPAGAENFVTGWSNGTGETCTVTDYPMYIEGIGDVVAKRITGNGAGSVVNKYYCAIPGGLSKPHTITASVYAMVLSGNAKIRTDSSLGVSTAVTNTMSRINILGANFAYSWDDIYFGVNAASDILDIVVYAPQIELKSYATPYTPPGTTRAAETLAIPVNAYQKNLLTQNQATGGDALATTVGFSGSGASVITRDTTTAWNGAGSIKIVTNGVGVNEGVIVDATTLTVGRIYTASAYIHGSGTVRCRTGAANGSVVGTSAALSGTRQRFSVTFPCLSSSGLWLFETTGTEAATFYIDGLQLEEGTTASDWALPVVDYTNALIDPAQPFSIEFDAIPTVDDKSTAKYLFGFGTSANYFIVWSNITSGYYGVVHRYNSGTTRVVNSSTAVVANTKATHKISVSGGQFVYSLNGVDIGTGTFDGLPSLLNWLMYFGSAYDGTIHRNAKFSNIRIRKGVALTAAERAYTGQLKADQYTTFYAPFKVVA